MCNEDDLLFTSESPARKRYERALKDDSLVDEVEMDWWLKLLEERPELIRKSDFNKHNGYELGHLFFMHPEVASKEDWARLGKREWLSIIGLRPELAKFCDRSKVEIPDDEWDAALKGVEPPQSIFNVGGLLL